MAHAFISYSRKDSVFVERLEAALQARSVTVWRDAISIPGGDDWYRQIEFGLANAYAVIAIVTPNADESKWVRREQLRADEDNIPTLAVHPARHRNPLHLQEVQPILMDEPNFSAGLLALIDALARCQKRARAVNPGAPAQADRAAIEAYLKFVLAEAKADLRDALYVDLEAQPERAPRPAAHALAAGLDDELDFSLFGVALERVRGALDAPGEPVPDARPALLEMRRAVLLGDPGAGKTTTLLKLTVDLARAAQTDPTAKLPVYIPLREFDGARPFAEFVRSKAHNLASALDGLADRLVLLCDALNEMPRTAASDGRDLIAEVRALLETRTDWVVSCRVRDYTDDLSGVAGVGKIRLKPLDPPRIRDFILRKYAGWGDAPRGEALWRELKGSDDLIAAWQAFAQEGVQAGFWGREWLPEKTVFWSEAASAWNAMHADHRRLLLLCRSPFMANLICTLYRGTARLPDNRAGLYAGFVASLLHAEGARRAAVGLAWIGDGPIRAGLGELAWAMGAQTELDRPHAEAILKAHLPDHDPGVLLSAAASAGLIELGAAVRFSHQLIGQYFAASVLGRLLDADGDPAAIWADDRWWQATGREETAILLAGDRGDPQRVARWIAPAQPELALELLTQPDFALDLSALDAPTRAALVAGARGKADEPNPVWRAAAYRMLADLDADDRPGVGLRPDGPPDIDWVSIPGGEFIYGDDDKSAYPLYVKPADRQVLTLPAFQISRYLVTYAQFQAFIDAPDGWDKSDWWKGLVGVPEAQRQAPDDQQFPYANHPRETVSWFQAVAFTRWLTARLQAVGAIGQEQRVSLPTEQQWERAARGTDGRAYPWRDDFDPARCNWGGSGIDMTSAVGIFPAGAALCGALDMSGNVWEWCLTDYFTGSQHENMNAEYRVLRGGSWENLDTGYLRAACRYWYSPDYRNIGWGFRLALL